VLRSTPTWLAFAGFVMIAVPAAAQQSSSSDRALRDLNDHGFTGMRCDSFPTLAGDRTINQVIGALVQGYVTGVGVALFTTTQDPGRAFLADLLRRGESQDTITTVAAAFISAFRGTPPIIEPQSIEARASQLSDYCQQHREETVEEAMGELLMKSWLKLPELPKPR
jgi:hypothetical protein